jgi:hypothetical protein
MVSECEKAEMKNHHPTLTLRASGRSFVVGATLCFSSLPARGVMTSLALIVAVLCAPLNTARADDLVSLDEPTTLESLDGTSVPAREPAPAAGSLNNLESLDGSAGLQSLDSSDGLQSLDNTDGLQSLDGAGGLQSLDSLSGSGLGESSGEIALDFGGEDFFNPYSFSRSRAWVILPFLSLILLGLHLLPVPKRQAKRKIDQSQRFFKGISGDNTSTGIEKMKLMAEKSKSRGDL